MVTKAERLEKAARRVLESAHLGIEIDRRTLIELGKLSKENAYAVMTHLNRLASQHQQVAVKHWRRGDRLETVEHVVKILSASRDAAHVLETYRIRPKFNYGWPDFGRAAIFSYLLDGEFDPLLLKLCKFSAQDNIVRQNDRSIVNMHLAKCISSGRVENGFRSFMDAYFRSPTVRLARKSYLAYATLIDAIEQQDDKLILSSIEVCEQNYLDRANDLSYSSFDLGEGTAGYNVHEIDYRLAAIIKMILTRLPKLKRKISSLHQWRFPALKSTKLRSLVSSLQILESSQAEKPETKAPKKQRKLRGIAKPSDEGLVGVSPSGEFIAISQGPGLAVWRTANCEKLFAIVERNWKLVCCDWNEDTKEVVTLERNLGDANPKSPSARVTWRDGNTGVAIRSTPYSGPGYWRAIGCSPDAKLLAAIHGDGRASVVDAKSGRTLRRWKTGNHVHSLAWSHDSLRLYVGGAHFVTCLSLGSSKPVWRARSAQYVVPVAASSDGRYVAFGSGNKIRVVNAQNGKSVMDFGAECLSIASVSFSHRADRLFVVEEQRRNTFSNELFARTIDVSTGATHEAEKVGSSTYGFVGKSDLLIVDRDYVLITASKTL